MKVYRPGFFRRIISFLYPQTIAKSGSDISSGIEVTCENGQLVMNTSRVNYSYGSLQEVFRRAFDKAELSGADFSKTLVLGFGAGSVAAILHDEMKKTTQITGVECDSEVIRTARKYFGLRRFPQLRIEETTAQEYVSHCHEKYDLIIVDVFVDDHVPEECSSEEFLFALKNIKIPGGRLFFNFILNDDNRRQYESFVAAFRKVFLQAREFSFRVSGAENHIWVNR